MTERRAVGRSLAGKRMTAACIRALVLLTIPVTARADIAALQWMSGCWTPDGQQAGSLEQWTAPAGSSMLGVSRTVHDGKTVFFEFLRIVEEADGWIGLIASPSGQETARFRMTRLTKHEVVFENPAHDYPQLISYRLTPGGKLLGHIEGVVDGATRAVDFPLTRTACDGDAAPTA